MVNLLYFVGCALQPKIAQTEEGMYLTACVGVGGCVHLCVVFVYVHANRVYICLPRTYVYTIEPA